MYGGPRTTARRGEAERRLPRLHGAPRSRLAGLPGGARVGTRGGRHDGTPRVARTLHLAKRAIVGRPLTTGGVSTTLLPKRLALPIFASDALSSVAYATEAALAVLLTASVSGGRLLVPISFAIAALLVLVVLSYRQTVRAYPGGGGSYVVASETSAGCRASSPPPRCSSTTC